MGGVRWIHQKWVLKGMDIQDRSLDLSKAEQAVVSQVKDGRTVCPGMSCLGVTDKSAGGPVFDSNPGPLLH